MWIRVDCKRLGDAYPDTDISISGRNIHAPLIERILELPMDIYEGERANLLVFGSSVCLKNNIFGMLPSPLVVLHVVAAVPIPALFERRCS